MLNFTGNLKVFVALEPCDLRKSFNGLQALVSQRLQEDPLQGGGTGDRHFGKAFEWWHP